MPTPPEHKGWEAATRFCISKNKRKEKFPIPYLENFFGARNKKMWEIFSFCCSAVRRSTPPRGGSWPPASAGGHFISLDFFRDFW